MISGAVKAQSTDQAWKSYLQDITLNEAALTDLF